MKFCRYRIRISLVRFGKIFHSATIPKVNRAISIFLSTKKWARSKSKFMRACSIRWATNALFQQSVSFVYIINCVHNINIKIGQSFWQRIGIVWSSVNSCTSFCPNIDIAYATANTTNIFYYCWLWRSVLSWWNIAILFFFTIFSFHIIDVIGQS